MRSRRRRPGLRMLVVVAPLVVALVVVVSLATGIVAAHRTPPVTLPASPARQAGYTERTFISPTSLSEVPGQLVTPAAAVDGHGNPLADSASIVAALRAWRWTGPAAAPRGYTMTVSATAGSTGEVLLPLPDRGVLTLDGRVVWGGRSPSRAARFDPTIGRVDVTGLGAGSHVLRWVPT